MVKNAGLSIKTLKNVDLENSSMCLHPWVGLDINPQGNMKPCCKFSKNISNNLGEYFQSSGLKLLKNKFLNGEKPSDCARCWRDEDAGLQSKRLLDWEYIFKKQVPDMNSLSVLSLPFGNSCNLACRTCNSFSSSTWGKEAKKIKSFIPDIEIFPHTRYYQDSNFINTILNQSDNLIHIDFPGGEPFQAGLNEHFDFLSKLKNKDKITLHYTTNGTKTIPKKFFDVWALFKHVDCQFSIDGTGDIFEYNRWPAKWSLVYDNLKYFQENHSELQLSISHTVSIFTIWHLNNFIDFCKKENLPDPYLGLLHNPSRYSIHVLPESTKKEISKRLQNPLTEPIKKDLFSNDFTSLLEETFKWIKILDDMRNQSFEKTFPELNESIRKQ
jgi:sulfatase maturation enzyme AslB (radical SAM superfamily)